MVSWTEQKQNIDGSFYGEGFCLDDDTKPTAGVACFDADGGSWGVLGGS